MDLNENILIGSGNYVDTAIILNPGAFDASFPASYLQGDEMWTFGRFTSTAKANTYIELDFGKSQAVSLVATLKANLGRVSKWRIRLADSQAALTSAPTFDSGWMDFHPPSIGFGDLAWGEFDWGDLTPYDILEQFNKHAFYPMESTVAARYARLDYDDEAEADEREDNYLQFAGIWFSDAYQPSLNVDYGAEVQIIDETAEQQMVSGARDYSPIKVMRRALTVTFDSLPRNELLLQVVGKMYMALGKSKRLIVLLEPQAPETFVYQAVYGNIKDVDKATHVSWKRVSAGLNVEEAV